MTTGLSARHWFITGISSGLGRQIAHVVLERGGCVTGTGRTQEAVAEFEAFAPGRARGTVLDVRDGAAVVDAVTGSEQCMGPVDVLVNNAGYQLVGAIEELGLDELRDQFEVNVLGALAMIQAVLPGMRARGAGRIINITSISGLAGWAGTGGYCASKFALEALGETLAQEVGPLGIHVSNVAPGGLRTDFTGRSKQRARRRIDAYADSAHASEQIIARHQGREPGDPAKAARAILQLAEASDPPMHLLLGEDALYYYARKAGGIQVQIAQWSALATSIAAGA